MMNKKMVELCVVLLSVIMSINSFADTSQKQLENNKQIVLDFYEKAINQKNVAEASVYLGSHYTQHNPNVAAPIGWGLISVAIVSSVSLFAFIRSRGLFGLMNPAYEHYQTIQKQLNQFEYKYQSDFDEVLLNKMESNIATKLPADNNLKQLSPIHSQEMDVARRANNMFR